MTTTLDAPAANWVDEIAVERAILGREPVGRPLTAAERTEAFRRLADAGYNATQICERLGLSGSTYNKLKRAYNAARDAREDQRP